ncbi:MAG: hypothetical protein ACREUN_09085 [Burkholderiales bacterium]
MDASVTSRRVLARAAAMLGGVERLAARFNLTQRQLADYLTGGQPVPDALFLAAIDVVLEELPDPHSPARAGAAERTILPKS